MSDIPNPEPRTEEQPETVTPPQPEIEPAVPPVDPNTPPADPPIDYEKKFSESTRENQILQARLTEAEKARKELTNEPTDSELQAAFPEWEYMSEPERRSARFSFEASRTARQLAAEREAEKSETRWKSDIEAAIIANPDLEGKEREFAEYANKPTHKGAPMQTLVEAFLYKSGKSPAPAPRPGLEPGNGGPKVPEKPKLLTPEDLKTLRENDPDAYRTYVATHDLSQLDI